MMKLVGNIAIVCVAALLCYGMRETKPRFNDLTRTIPVAGSMGETLATRFFDMRVDKVEFARALKTSQQTYTTSGVWAVVTTDLTATEAPKSIYRRVWEGPTGLRYVETGRIGSDFPTAFAAGLPQGGRLIFEIPPDQASGAKLLVSRDYLTEFDSEARITLDAIELTPDGTPAQIADVLDISQL
ncbi:hypothetical protein [Mesorhizobium sp. ZC-5]|uniref:hypothetical protein n=1 Tax=Mesorhizobium sp. ZC-5 TaxID=2986066 RepID=UPI0021E8F055|nr:hypothetical protein [Mesorhizobium sp. ZC-5]MCV3242260.1 hypothetical protein [Mesorhizobium sp. ZC-5]